MSLPIVRTVREVRARVREWRRAGKTVGLVPTMGAIHDGHLALVRRALATTERTCVTLFVNPKQFGPQEDLARYPRDEAGDAALLAKAGAHLLYAPAVEEIYPPAFATEVRVQELGDILEGAHRPGFFTGVATVVAKLLLQTLPDRAFFGEKDYQQLVVLRRLVADLDIPVAVEGCPTVREPDGLALSSRNAYLARQQRKIAPALYRSLSDAAERIAAGAEAARACRRGRDDLLAAGFAAVDYFEARNADTLAPLAPGERRGRVLAAARLGTTRLIDNVSIPPD